MKIRVLIGEHSNFARFILADILNAEPDIEVIDAAANCEELVNKCKESHPDVILTDIDLPGGGLYTMKKIMSDLTIPLIIAGQEKKLAEHSLLSNVYYTIQKPDSIFQAKLRNLKDELIYKIKQASGKKSFREYKDEPERATFSLEKLNLLLNERRQNRQTGKTEISHLIIIGSSTGGPTAVEAILKDLDPEIPAAIIVAQHMPEGFTATFANRLNQLIKFDVEEGKHGTVLEAGKIIIAPGNRNILVQRFMGLKNNLRIELTNEESGYDKPSIDLLMKSAAAAFGSNITGVILTGMGRDGTMGAKSVFENGGTTIAQDEDSSVIFGMAKSAISNGYISKVLPLSGIASYLSEKAYSYEG